MEDLDDLDENDKFSYTLLNTGAGAGAGAVLGAGIEVAVLRSEDRGAVHSDAREVARVLMLKSGLSSNMNNDIRIQAVRTVVEWVGVCSAGLLSYIVGNSLLTVLLPLLLGEEW